MKIRNTTTKLIGIVIAFGVLATIYVVWGSNRGEAFTLTEREFLLSPVGISSGQTVRVSVQVNPGPPNQEMILTRVSFLDVEGNRFNVFVPPEERGGVFIAPGSFAFFDLNRDALQIAGEPNGRIQLVGLVVVSSEPTVGVNITGEVFDNADGATTIFYPPNPLFPPNPSTPAVQ